MIPHFLYPLYFAYETSVLLFDSVCGSDGMYADTDGDAVSVLNDKLVKVEIVMIELR